MLRLESLPASTELPKRIVWEKGNQNEARLQINALVEKGFSIGESSDGECLLYPPPQEENAVCVRVLDETGDTRLVWNRKKLEELEEARRKFDDYMKKGYRAYVCRTDGTKGSKVESFDSLLEELILVEKSVAKQERVPKQIKAHGILVPPTTPG